jgi:S-adenosylmethionine:tRNA ribosyltransferase-isomerase
VLTSEFDYDLPHDLIAQQPLQRRDASRMMIVRRHGGTIRHGRFEDFPDCLNEGDALVLNDTKVIPARVWGLKNGREIEFLFLRELERGFWEVLCRPARKVRTGDRILFAPGFEGEIVGAGAEGRRMVRFSETDVRGRLKTIGFAPLPPYIKRRQDHAALREFDLLRYQTVFARREGSIAAPTAGLHFTPQILKKIEAKGVVICRVTLEVGLATFQPVRVDRLEDHAMLTERYTVGRKAAEEINRAKREGRPVVAVGTTVVRTLESAWTGDPVRAGSRSTGLFIYPGFTFRVVDRLLTNFHLPRSTLLMLVSAFAGVDLIRKAYAEAVDQKYRFYSYGDCMLIL